MLRHISAAFYVLNGILIAGCFNDSLLKANQQQLQQQQTELEQLKQDVAALQTSHPAINYTPSPPGACDQKIMREATRKGGEQFAANDFSGALSYYQDALTACPDNAQANLNLARTYEAVGDRAQAVAHYRAAAKASGAEADAEAASQARAALSRLGG